MSTNCARHAKQRDRPLLPPSIACLEVVRWGDMRCKIKTAPSPPLTPSLLQVCEQLMTMHLAGRRSAAGKPSSPGKSHLLRHSQLAAGVPDAIVSHTKGHADVVLVPKLEKSREPLGDRNRLGISRAETRNCKIEKKPKILVFRSFSKFDSRSKVK